MERNAKEIKWRNRMFTRRNAIKLAGAAGALSMTGRADAASTVRTPVDFKVPPGACDCHVHVFPDPARFPFWSGRGYTPPVATASDLLALQHALHMDRVVIVTPSVYGTDNAATLDGMRQLGRKRARGVAVIGPATTKAEIDTMDKAGVRGIRVNLESNGVTDPAAAATNLDAAVAMIKDTGWHMQFYARLPVIAALKDRLAAMPMPAVFDHFAGTKAVLGVDQPGFDVVLGLVRSGKAYVKISGAYRASDETPNYPKVAPLAKALIAANPERVIWGSDWPHPGPAGRTPMDINVPFPVDDGRLLNLMAEWAPDAATRKMILVDNPARLYGF
jgi:predicted TIM-barrel fold metal-dependent hydrolase